MKNCKYCGVNFEPTSKKSIFCSLKCRQADYRKRLIEANRLMRGKVQLNISPPIQSNIKEKKVIPNPSSPIDAQTDETMSDWEKQLLQLRQNKNNKK